MRPFPPAFGAVAARTAIVDTAAMTESLPDAGADHNLPIFSVGEISQALKSVVEESFAWVRVRGEISGFKRAASGHLYLALKDALAARTPCLIDARIQNEELERE